MADDEEDDKCCLLSDISNQCQSLQSVIGQWRERERERGGKRITGSELRTCSLRHLHGDPPGGGHSGGGGGLPDPCFHTAVRRPRRTSAEAALVVVRTTSDSSSRSSGNLRHSQTKAEKSTREDFFYVYRVITKGLTPERERFCLVQAANSCLSG